MIKYSRLAFSGNFVFMWGMISFCWLAFPLYILVIRKQNFKKKNPNVCEANLIAKQNNSFICPFLCNLRKWKKKIEVWSVYHTDCRKMQYQDEHFSWYFEFTMKYKLKESQSHHQHFAMTAFMIQALFLRSILEHSC